MAKLLRIDCSARDQGSHSREIADFFQKTWLDHFPAYEVILQDLAKQHIPHIDTDTIRAYQTKREKHDHTLKKASALSDQLIAELLSADVLLFSIPMYNFSIPSTLKAYIDQIVRSGFTFNYDPDKGLQGLLRDKHAVVCMSSGAVFSDPAMAALDHVQPYMTTLLNFLGITQIDVIKVEGTTTDSQAMARSIQTARQQIQNLVKQQEKMTCAI